MSSSSIPVATGNNSPYHNYTNNTNSSGWGKASSTSVSKQEDIKPKPAASAHEEHEYGDDFEDYDLED